MENMKAIAVIPARLASTRLPRKMVREIAGKPLLGIVYEAVRSSPLLDRVIVATDSDEILAVCRQNGWEAEMTASHHRSGTERVHEVSGRVMADAYINVQGDEPLTRPEHIATLLGVIKDPSVQVATVMTPASEEDIPNPNAVKVVTDASGRALYFSGHDSLRSRWHAAALLQAPRPVRLPQSGAGPVCDVAGIFYRESRTARAVAVPGEWHPDLRGRDSL